MEEKEKIDFVIMWVDGSDPEWIKEKLKYQGIENVNTYDVQNNITRYRDMGTLKYWFRGVEKFAPWVNNIYFVTCGHLPSFLNVNHPKLKIVSHKEFISEEFLPTFSSSAIEMNIHKIQNLSEKFVLFNDDTFLTDFVPETTFFENDLPRGYAILSPIIPSCSFEHNVINDVMLINQHYNLNEVLKKYHNKFFSFKYGINLVRTIFLKQWGKICGFRESHLPHAFLKSSFNECNKIYKKEFENTWSHKFRHIEDITQWLIEYWQYVNGKFEPISPKVGQLFNLSGDNKDAIEAIKNKKFKMICLNDGNPDLDFEKAKIEIAEAFEKILPDKSQFEL